MHRQNSTMQQSTWNTNHTLISHNDIHVTTMFTLLQYKHLAQGNGNCFESWKPSFTRYNYQGCGWSPGQPFWRVAREHTDLYCCVRNEYYSLSIMIILYSFINCWIELRTKIHIIIEPTLQSDWSHSLLSASLYKARMCLEFSKWWQFLILNFDSTHKYRW